MSRTISNTWFRDGEQSFTLSPPLAHVDLDPNQNAARIVAASTKTKETPTPPNLEAAWAEWSKGIKNVDDRARTLLRAAFEAGHDAGRRA